MAGAALALAVACTPVAATADAGAVFSGRVVEARTGQPLAGVRVAVSSAYGDLTSRSRSDGRFTFVGLAAGRTIVTLDADGFAGRECAYLLWPGGDTRVTFVLSPVAATLRERIAPCPAAPVGGGETQDVYVIGD